jgi:hypothetical protein
MPNPRPDRIGALEDQVRNPFQRWPHRRVIAPEFVVSPGVGEPLLGRDKPVVAMGSCFAAEIRNYLAGRRYPFVGIGPKGDEPPRPFFNTASIRQEVQRAFGAFAPAEKVWRTRVEKKVCWLDPYRHNAAFSGPDAVDAETEKTTEAMRTMFRAARLVILTIGQAEVWYSKADGAVFSAIPPRDVLDPAEHAWRLLGYEENLANLNRTVELLAMNAPAARIVLTLSPVPLLATFRPMNAVVANGEGKAILRAALGKVAAVWAGRAFYFPSYEIAQSLLRAKAFRPDGRHVVAWGVARIMKAFERWAA